MELLLLGLAGLGGFALLLQQKPLPSQDDVIKALDKLDKDPADPDANTIAGKYKAFVMGDYEGAMPYLVQSKDATLKTLATHELDATYTALPAQKVTMGDEWVNAAKKFPTLNRIFYDRAAQWYTKGWAGLEGAQKEKARIQGQKLSASRPPGNVRKGVPAGWVPDPGISGNAAESDATIARTGSYSVKVPPGRKDVQGSASAFRSIFIPISGNMAELSAYVRSDGTENGADSIYILFWNNNNDLLGAPKTVIPIDTPFWNRTSFGAVIPKDATRLQVQASNYSKNGNIWVDDVSVKVDGKEIIKNGSFETP